MTDNCKLPLTKLIANSKVIAKNKYNDKNVQKKTNTV